MVEVDISKLVAERAAIQIQLGKMRTEYLAARSQLIEKLAFQYQLDRKKLLDRDHQLEGMIAQNTTDILLSNGKDRPLIDTDSYGWEIKK